MPCYHPRPGHIVLANKVPLPSPMPEQLPCGKCIGCRAKHAQEWAIRLYHESLTNESSVFLTLTYDPKHIALDNSLVPVEATKFLHRLRAHLGPKSFRYYLVGEYGDETQRPHYHVLLFGYHFPDRTFWMHRHGDPTRPVFISDLLTRKWGLGNADIEPLTPGAVKYVAGYVQKKLNNKPDRYFDRKTGAEIIPEYSRMSRKPGIGSRWIQRNWRDVYPADSVTMDGRVYRPPLYYDRWAQQDHIGKKGALCTFDDCIEHQERFEEARYAREDYIPNPRDTSFHRLQQREVCHTARYALTKRETS